MTMELSFSLLESQVLPYLSFQMAVMLHPTLKYSIHWEISGHISGGIYSFSSSLIMSGVFFHVCNICLSDFWVLCLKSFRK